MKWHVTTWRDTPNGQPRVGVRDEQDRKIVDCGYASDPDARARAALIAKAPAMHDLLSRLKRFVDDADDDGSPLLIEICELLDAFEVS